MWHVPKQLQPSFLSGKIKITFYEFKRPYISSSASLHAFTEVATLRTSWKTKENEMGADATTPRLHLLTYSLQQKHEA